MTTSTKAETVTEYLQTDHRRLDGLMESCQSLAGAGDMAGAALRFEEFREGLLRHIRIEEELLFPAFDAATGLQGDGPTAVMRHEHAEIQRLLESIRDLLAGERPEAAEFESLRSALVALLHAHNVKEERIVYPMSDRLLPPAERRQLVGEMQAYR